MLLIYLTHYTSVFFPVYCTTLKVFHIYNMDTLKHAGKYFRLPNKKTLEFFYTKYAFQFKYIFFNFLMIQSLCKDLFSNKTNFSF
uniref:Uncharacterized protein n=1 Tax=Anguilla anguilla TaxID=7936 RepID=A0A0E9WBS6_ANGAN